jgi:hypothetical protein
VSPPPLLLRAELTTQASEFVQAIRRADELEAKNQTGSSLSWYLKARRIYPASTFAKAGIERLSVKVLPGAK